MFTGDDGRLLDSNESHFIPPLAEPSKLLDVSLKQPQE
jgi:hypothetical protein